MTTFFFGKHRANRQPQASLLALSLFLAAPLAVVSVFGLDAAPAWAKKPSKEATSTDTAQNSSDSSSANKGATDSSRSEPTKSASNSGVDQKTLAQLEERYFQMKYSDEAADQRLERIEKFIFGEARTGQAPERLASILAIVPPLTDETKAKTDSTAKDNTDQVANEDSGSSKKSRKSKSKPNLQEAKTEEAKEIASKPSSQNYSDDSDEASSNTSSKDPTDLSDYPAVTAIEQKLFKQAYSRDPIQKRLDRLEMKQLGKTYSDETLFDRLDRLKQTTGIDIAKQAPPPNTDWAEEDDDELLQEVQKKASRRATASGGGALNPYSSGAGGSYGVPGSRSSSGRFGGMPGSGSFGMGGSLGGMTAGMGGMPGMGSYGTGRGFGMSGMQGMTPGGAVSSRPPSWSDQVGALEQAVFGKVSSKDALTVRIAKLEQQLLPTDAEAGKKPLPDRVNKLMSVMNMTPESIQAQKVAQNKGNNDDDFSDLDAMMNSANMANGGLTVQKQTKGGGGLGKLLGAIGDILTGGNMMNGGYYGTSAGSFVLDPQSGFLINQTTGMVVDPNTGAVIQQRLVPSGGTGIGSFGSFGSGLSPYGGTPYGLGSGSGLQFGFGSIGRPGIGF
jgi:hypothetical protein